MKILKNMEKLSLLAIGASALSLSNPELINAQAIQGKVTENINLRNGPSTNDTVILTIKKNSFVEILKYSDNWAYVKYNNQLGYASKQYILEIHNNNNTTTGSSGGENSNKSELMECNVDLLNVRKAPSTSEQVIASLNKGDRVEVMYHTSRGWSRIRLSNGYGYVSTQYLSSIKLNPTPEKYTTMLCSANKLNIRKGPSTKEEIIGSLKKGDKIDVINHTSNNWSKIKFNNSYAYVSTTYLSSYISSDASSSKVFMTCNAFNLNVRKGPSINDSIVGNLKNGDKVEIIYKVNNDWYKINYNNGFAYVHSKYLY